ERQLLADVLQRLEGHYDLDLWHWRADTRAFDICIGAILVQHTSWTNVERALHNLRDAGVDSIKALLRIPLDELALLVRPAGMPVTKAARLQAFASLAQENGGLEQLLRLPRDVLRCLLLGTRGIGRETADV